MVNISQLPRDGTSAEFPELQITPDKLRGIPEAHGPGGIGTFLIEEVLSEEHTERLLYEIGAFDPNAWRDNHGSYVNKRGLTIVENHTTLAFKLLQGDQSYADHLPGLRDLATQIQSLIRGLAWFFPKLDDWTADEMSLHRYDNPEIGLSFHKDNLRFIGEIAVATLDGSKDFAVLDEDGSIVTIPTPARSLTLTRATDLWSAYDTQDRQINLCPDHAVLGLKTDTSTSFIVRANSRPDEAIEGFSYINWEPKT